MTLFPDRRLLRALTAWLVAAVLTTAWPPLLVPVLAAGIALAGLAAWDAWRLLGRPRTDVARQVPARAVVDRVDAIGYRIHNPASVPVRIELEDEWAPDLADRSPHVERAVIDAGATRELRFPIRPQRRGDRPLGNLLVFEASALGLFRQRRTLRDGTRLPVYPDAQRLAKAAALDPKQLLGRTGLRPTRRRGQGSDFESLRDYVVGDDPRHIDWAATARRGNLVTRLYQHERNHTIVLAVDCSRLMGARCSDARTKLDHAVDAALTLSLAALARGDRVEVLLFDREIRGHVAPRVHRGGVAPVVELLRHAEATAVEADYAKLVRALLSRRRGRALAVLLTDFAEAESADIEAPLRLLRRHYRTLLVALRDPVFARLEPAAADAAEGFYERLAIDELLHDREGALARLRHAAIQSIDLPPERIAAPLLNRYLEFRYASV